MHQTRKTHNAHSETKRQLRRLSKKEWNITIPHYNIVSYSQDNLVRFIELCWNYVGSFMAPMKNHFGGKHIKTIQESEFAKEHSFYTRFSKSKSSYWRWAKKRLHKIWRRKPLDKLTFTYKDAIGCSLYGLW